MSATENITIQTEIWGGREYTSAACTCCTYRSNWDPNAEKTAKKGAAHAKKCKGGRS